MAVVLLAELAFRGLLDVVDPVFSKAIVLNKLLHLLFMQGAAAGSPRRHDNEGFHETELEIEDKTRKEDTSYSPTLISMPMHIKPIVERTKVNMNRPKLLVKEVTMMLLPLELNFDQSSVAVSGDAFPPQRSSPSRDLTLYEKYVASDLYQCLYHKFTRERLDRLSSNDVRRLFSKTNFASYFVNLDFLAESPTILMRNLEERSLGKLLEDQLSGQFDSRFECGNLFAVFRVPLATCRIGASRVPTTSCSRTTSTPRATTTGSSFRCARRRPRCSPSV